MADSDYDSTFDDYERKFHADIIGWIAEKVNAKTPASTLLDVSIDGCTFTYHLAETLKTVKNIVTVNLANGTDAKAFGGNNGINTVRLSLSMSSPPLVAALKAVLETNGTSAGKFDVIVFKEVLHIFESSPSLDELFACAKELLAPSGHIVIMTRPKNPPLPLPDVCMETWRKTALSRDQILEAAIQAGLQHDTYSASTLLKFDSLKWGWILKSRRMSAVRFSPKCSDRVIDEYVRSQNKQMQFEEKMLIILLNM